MSGREIIPSGRYAGCYHLNKHEENAWKGPKPIHEYPIYDDPNPKVIRKNLDRVNYVKELAVRYLNPGLAPKPGDLIIRERAVNLPPAPPLVVRQEGSRPHTPPPLIFREAPPAPPVVEPEQVYKANKQNTDLYLIRTMTGI